MKGYRSYSSLMILLCIYYLFFKEILIYFNAFPYVLFFLPIVIILLFFTPSVINLKRIPKNVLFFILIAFVYIIVDAVTLDVDGLLEQLKFFLGIIALYSLARISTANPYFLPRYAYYFLLIMIIYSLTVPSATISIFTDNSRFYLGSAHHWAKALIFIVLYYCWYINWPKDKKIRVNNIFLLIVFAFIIFMSGSRAGMLAIMYIGLILYMNQRFKMDYKYVLIFLIFLTCSYFLAIALNGIVFSSHFGKLLKMDQVNDLSSGRLWLQGYHILVFVNNLPLGAPADLLEFKVGDLVNGEVASAASESMFTFILAREGLLGCVKLLLIFYIFVLRPYKEKNFIGYLTGTTIVLLSATLSVLNNSYSFSYITFVWLYFCMEILHKPVKSENGGTT